MTPPDAESRAEAGAEAAAALMRDLLAPLRRLDAALAELTAVPEVPAHLRTPAAEVQRVRARLACLRADLMRRYHALPAE
jgi:hypothetical protein